MDHHRHENESEHRAPDGERGAARTERRWI
jgi:hypothetical protein